MIIERKDIPRQKRAIRHHNILVESRLDIERMVIAIDAEMHHTPEHAVRTRRLEFRQEVDRLVATYHHTSFHRATLAPDFDAPRRPVAGDVPRDQDVQRCLVDLFDIDARGIDFQKVEIVRLILGRRGFPETQDSLDRPRGHAGRERAGDAFPC